MPWAPGGATTVAAVIGDPIRHSRSPAIVNAAFRALDLDWVYVAFAVPAGGAGAALDAMRTLGLGGLSVTMPHKAEVAAAVDERTPAAAALEAVNCVTAVHGRLVGHNTDGAGFVRSLADEAPEHPIADARCVVLGAGGAARAIVAALADAGAADVAVVNRTAATAEHAAALAPGVGRTAAPGAVAGADIVVNATSVGMGEPPGGAVPCDVGLLRPGQLVVDIVYQPLVTPLLAAAAERGATPLGGLGMLVHQAAVAVELWTGRQAPAAVMRAAAEQTLG